MNNWLQNKGGFTNLPISYIIFKNTTPLTMYHSEFIIYNARLITDTFKAYRRKVSNILTPLVLGTSAFEWGGKETSQGKGR